jgi:dipeptidyl aminopeptidase/acylaminoacyl peptidase
MRLYFLPALLVAVALPYAITVELRSTGRVTAPAPTQNGVGETSPSQEQKRPFTFEDMMKLKRVEEPVVSPDGKWVLFAAVDVDLKANTKTPHVWAVPLDTHISQKRGDPSTTLRAGVGHPAKAGSSTPQHDSPLANHPASVGMTGGKGSGMTGGSEKKIISDQDADRPRWSPDGKRFAFVSTKEDGSQIWVADFDNSTGTVTAKHRLTDIATEADGELWSPDGKNILFVSNVYPECDGRPDEEYLCNQKLVDDAKGSKVKAQSFTHLLYRHWSAYEEGRRNHLFITDAQAVFPPGARDYSIPLPRDLTPGDHDVPPFHLGGPDRYAFSPDGQEICFTSNHAEDEAISTDNDLFVVPVTGATGVSPVQARNITAENKAADETPLYSPDGKYIAYRAQARPGYESDRWRLMLYDRRSGARKDLTEDFDHWVESFVWARDSKTIYFSAEHERHGLIYAVDASPASRSDNKTVEFLRRALVGGYNDDLTIAPDGKTLVFTRMSIAAPNEIYASAATGNGCPARTGDVDPGKWDCSLSKDWPVTRLNAQLLSQISMAAAEPFGFTGAHGDWVEGSLVKPPTFDSGKKYPVKFLIHGGPQQAWGDDWSYRWNPELFAADGYVVMMINFHGSTGYGQKFIDAINGDWGGAPFEDLMKGLDYAEQHYPFIDKDRECALGASYGGYMVNWILGHTNRFKCMVSHDGTFNTESAWGTTEELWFPEWEFHGPLFANRELYRKWSPHLYAENFKTPTLVVHGQLDYRLDVSEGFQLLTTLQRMGVPSKMLYFPDEGHWVLKPQNSQLWYKTVNEWVDRWVGK